MKTCPIHKCEYEGRCHQCRGVAARIGYYRRAGRPVPDDIQEHWRPGATCSVCGEAIFSEADKHPRTCTHRLCGDQHTNVWRRGDPCTKCGLPVEINDKHKRFKAHAKCIKKQIEETKAKARVARTAYNKKRWAAKAKQARHKLPKMYVGPQTRTPQPPPVVIGDVKVRRIPSLLPPSLRNPATGTFWEMEV